MFKERLGEEWVFIVTFAVLASIYDIIILHLVTQNWSQAIFGAKPLSPMAHSHTRFYRKIHLLSVHLIVTEMIIHSSFVLVLNGSTAPSGPGRHHCQVFEIILRHTALIRTPLNE